MTSVETAGLKSAAAHAAKTKAFFQKCPDISNLSYFRLLTFGRGNRAQFSGAFRLLSIVALAIKPLARETACLPYRMLSAWLYFLAMNNLLAGQQATRRRASKTGTEEDNITPVNSTRKAKKRRPRRIGFSRAMRRFRGAVRTPLLPLTPHFNTEVKHKDGE